MLKKLAYKIIKSNKRFRRYVIELNDSIIANRKLCDEEKSKKDHIYDNSIFTSKSTFTGYSIDYLNSRVLSKKERECELKQIFYRNCGYYLDLDNPQTFNQKLQWLKMNYYNSEEARCVDKLEFKKYIAEKIGAKYVVPLYQSWENESAVSFEKLPDKFVLKSNLQSDSRHIIVINDKRNVDLDRLKTVLATWLSPKNTLINSYCCAYKDIKPMIIAEKYIECFDSELMDYKFMCFNGKVEMLFVVADRKTGMGVNFYDLNWNLLPFTRKYPNTAYPIKKPKNFEKMVELAGILSKAFPFVRVDFYESEDGKDLYVGELTFYPGGGYEPFQPIEYDYILGEKLNLPEANIFD